MVCRPRCHSNGLLKQVRQQVEKRVLFFVVPILGALIPAILYEVNSDDSIGHRSVPDRDEYTICLYWVGCKWHAVKSIYVCVCYCYSSCSYLRMHTTVSHMTMGPRTQAGIKSSGKSIGSAATTIAVRLPVVARICEILTRLSLQSSGRSGRGDNSRARPPRA